MVLDINDPPASRRVTAKEAAAAAVAPTRDTTAPWAVPKNSPAA